MERAAALRFGSSFKNLRRHFHAVQTTSDAKVRNKMEKETRKVIHINVTLRIIPLPYLPRGKRAATK